MPFRAVGIQVAGLEFNALNRDFINALTFFLQLIRENRECANHIIKDWFGDQKDYVLQKIKDIIIYFQNSAHVIIVRMAKEGELTENSVGAANECELAICLGNAWLSLSLYVDCQNQNNDRGKIKTLFHELSHLVLNTEDMGIKINVLKQKFDRSGQPNGEMQVPENFKCYGIEKCKKLAQEISSQAIQNADNWGYFLESIYRCYLNCPVKKSIF